MQEFFQFLVISNLSLLVVWGSYKLFLENNTFHGWNRAYLLIGSVLSLVIPLLPTQRTTSEALIGIELPTLDVSGGILQTTVHFIPLNPYFLFYSIGLLVALWFFVQSLASLVSLLKQSESETLHGVTVLRSEKAGPFSFLTIIHLPKYVSPSHLETVLRHEMAHVKLMHTYDVLWLRILQILFWFNPLLLLYKQSLQAIHEYQADALTQVDGSKERYVEIQVEQLFDLPRELSLANSFYNPINLKKRVNMIYSEKTSKWATMRYAVAVPVIAIVALMTACTEVPVDLVEQETDKVYENGVEVMPEYVGGMAALFAFVGEAIRYPEAAEAENITGKVFVGFVVDKNGKVGQVEVVKGVRDDLDSEAVRVVSEMPDWTPGMHDGKKVSVHMVLPISYQL